MNCIEAALDERNSGSIKYLNGNVQWETLVTIFGPRNKKETDMITWTFQIPSREGRQQSCGVINSRFGILTQKAQCWLFISNV